jgi:F-box protein 2
MGGVKGVATSESVPDAVFAKIFALLPSAQIASSCALVCRAWRDYTHDATLWSELCEGSGLRAIDAMRCLGGWKGLFGSVYGVNLVASPHFERVHFYDADRLKHEPLRPWEPKHRLIIDRICSDDESNEESHSYGYWATEGGSVFQRGGGDGVLRECPPLDCPPCPAAQGKPALATSWDWGKVQQYVGLQTFSNKFLDCSPPMTFSIWYAGTKGAPSVFKAAVVLRDELKNIIFYWYVTARWFDCCASI